MKFGVNIKIMDLISKYKPEVGRESDRGDHSTKSARTLFSTFCVAINFVCLALADSTADFALAVPL